ncbi:uncharacterized protein LOC125066118 [Vanessa atalanta]|uniref:uncharacterized protein LOC125066118 n=1 Tax=Vanessa atalanta TaxID=42275 RepID=UPI001FCDDFD8|nr:uncharacterized protein LOC125066118 [Vanessa atalanta]
MTNTLAVCLFSILFFCCSSLSSARQIPKECSKGPDYWCENLTRAAACGAVQHCIGTVWEHQHEDIKRSYESDRIIRLFRQLKDVKDMINEDYVATSVRSACSDLPSPAVRSLCKDNTASLESYVMHLLQSDTTPETMCRLIGMCNNDKLKNLVAKKNVEVQAGKQKVKLVGGAKCTWGPSYWCSNFSTGRECGATHHCVERVWSKMTFPEDNDGICKICKDMVTQARDQLQSNETQEELKEVFEGECKLIPIKVVTKECIKLADDFVPELVETLASEMNPDAVCSVAGLCNNANIDRLIEDYNATLKHREDCSNCRRSVGIVRKRFDETSYENFLVGILQVCQNMGSLSDSCSMLTFKYYENIIEALKKDLTPQSICHLSGQCTHLYHSHNLYTFPDELKDLKATDDVPCEFCEQVIKHMRDTLVANTSEVEFHKVLTGLCKHTGNFKSECLQLVEQYHSVIYYYLVSELKPDEICGFIGICTNKTDVTIAPLLPKELAVKAITMSPKLIGEDEANSYTTQKARVPLQKQANVQILGTETTASPALPIERMFVATPKADAWCSFCQYFLHYVQVELSDDNNEEAIKKAVEEACDVLPQSINDECRQFVTQYGPAVIALLVQEIDPASVCPALGLCAKKEEVRRVSINSEKSNCPLCLFAVEQLETMLKNNRSEESIRKALDGLCTHLSSKLRTQCVDFVDTYTNQLVEMLVADLNAQEICVYLKLCKDDKKHTDPLALTHSSIDKYHNNPSLRGDRNNRKHPMLPKEMLENGPGDISTNEIPDNTQNGRPIKVSSQRTVCVVCEFVLKEIDDQIKDKHNEDEIKMIVHGVCKHMPKSVRGECDQFVDKYADLVISLLAQELNADEVCRELKLCDPTAFKKFKEEILDCAVCETVVMAVKKVLSNDKVDRNIVHVIEKSCSALPAKYNARCHTMLEIYGEGVIHLIEEFGTKDICKKIGLCSTSDAAIVRMHRNN